jgi:hypothetical protein
MVPQTKETRTKLREWLTTKPSMGWVEEFRDTLDTCDALEARVVELERERDATHADLKGLGRGAFVVNGGGAINLLDQAKVMIEEAHADANQADARRTELERLILDCARRLDMAAATGYEHGDVTSVRDDLFAVSRDED